MYFTDILYTIILTQCLIYNSREIVTVTVLWKINNVDDTDIFVAADVPRILWNNIGGGKAIIIIEKEIWKEERGVEK